VAAINRAELIQTLFLDAAKKMESLLLENSTLRASLEQAEKKFSKGYVVCIRPDRVTDDHLRELKERCNTRDAEDSISFIVMHPEGKRQYLTTMKIKTSKENTAFLCSTFGESNVLIDTER